MISSLHDLAEGLNFLTPTDTPSLTLEAVLWGFQIGHDYALTYGRILKEG